MPFYLLNVSFIWYVIVHFILGSYICIFAYMLKFITFVTVFLTMRYKNVQRAISGQKRWMQIPYISMLFFRQLNVLSWASNVNCLKFLSLPVSSLADRLDCRSSCNYPLKVVINWLQSLHIICCLKLSSPIKSITEAVCQRILHKHSDMHGFLQWCTTRQTWFIY